MPNRHSCELPPPLLFERTGAHNPQHVFSACLSAALGRGNPVLMTAPPIRGISSMATRAVLAELASACEQRAGVAVQIESVGGVDAAMRVQAGEPFDVVVLASDAIDKLAAGGAT